MSKTRTTVPLALSTVTGLAAATLMFVLPTNAEPLPTTYAAKASGDLFHIDKINLDMLDQTDDVDLSVTRVEGVVGSTTSPRSLARAENVAGTSASGQSARRGVSSSATNTSDNTLPVAGIAPAGVIGNMVELAQAPLSSLGRWVGDKSCLAASDRLTTSRAQSDGSNFVATEVPAEEAGVTIPIVDIEVPVPDGGVPLPLPDPGLPGVPVPGLPTSTPTETPTLPADPTEILTIATGTPTISLPPLPEPTLPLPRANAAAPGGKVVMAELAPSAVEQHTWLPESSSPSIRSVRAEAIGTAIDLGQPIVSFFDKEIAIRMASQPRLTANADGESPAKVTWTPPALTLLVSGQASPLNVPPDGTPVTVNYSANRQVVVKVSAGQLTDKVEDPNGLTASGSASALHVTITRETSTGPLEVLDADLLPMHVEATAPGGGVDCTPPAITPVSPKLKVTGKDNGPKPDRITINAQPKAAGAKATVFTTVKRQQRKLVAGVVNDRGDRVFKIKDRNGKKPTKYVVKLGATTLTTSAKASKRVR